jgi:hypothetical protein
MTSSPTSEIGSPIAELQQMLSDAGDDVAKIFGPALSTFAGPYADTKSPKDKLAELERLIIGNQK